MRATGSVTLDLRGRVFPCRWPDPPWPWPDCGPVS